MQIKALDDKRRDIDALRALLAPAGVNDEMRRRIEQEIRTVGAGAQAERDAAYEIEFHFGPSRNYMTLHGLRIECNGRVAQIDHLIVNRLLQLWVCESKAFAEGVRINEYGEWERFFQGRPQGMASPIEQNRRHLAVLEDVFAKGLVTLPRRLGFRLTPELRSLVLVSNKARIERPTARVEGLETVIKVEKLEKTVRAGVDESGPTAMRKLVGSRAIEDLARQLAALHRPIAVNWEAKLGLVPR